MAETKVLSKSMIDFIYLVSCGLHKKGLTKDELKDIDLRHMYKMAEYHSLTSTLAFCLELSDVEDKEIQAKFIFKRNNTIKKSILFDAKRTELVNKFEEKGIYYVPLKYINLVNLFPELGMREFADNDIYYDVKKRKELVKIFKDMDFEVESVGKIHHDTFLKKPIYNFEMHTYLFEKSDPALHKYYKDISRLIIKDENNKYGYHFKQENDYIYDLAHAYKHFIKGGNGLRYLLDVYVYNTYAKNLDRDFIEQELAKTELTDFEHKSKSIALKIFSEPKREFNLSEDELAMLLYVLGSGTYGNLSNSVENEMKSKHNTKAKYILHRLFPGWDWCKKYHPFFFYTIIFIPFLMLGRGFKGLFISRKKAMAELEIVNQIEKERENKKNETKE